MRRPVMSLLRRATAFLASLLVLQLTLAGGGVRSRVHRAESAHGMTTHGMSAHWTMASSQESDTPCHALAGDDHCTFPGSDTACDAMTSCIPSLLAARAHESGFVRAPLGGVPAGPAMVPPTRTTPPELPPPRV